ncbi:MAG: glycosyltransferase [Streptosporangiales bacterium]|nr:glycosyltransferase [Streptosporangiales bacterium]
MAPRLSVVVPIYNVESYLEACLASIASQSLRELQIVCVDDGSTDASAAIAEDFASRDARFTVLRRPNAGLGAARNVGAAHADGDYLAFADSDDVVPGTAYELMIDTLETTGSDFATGNVHRLWSSGIDQSPLHLRPLGRAARLRTHVTRDRLLLYDRLAPNKVFRRPFWDRHRLAFPEGVLYEDIPVTIPAHFLADSVDVLKQPVYYWRQRETAGDLSITQRRTEPDAIRDRVAAVDSVSRFLADRGPSHARHKRWYDEVVLDSDLRIFLNILPDGDDAFRTLFLDLANDYLDRIDPGLLEAIPKMALRLKWQLVRRRMLAELLEVLRFERSEAPLHLTPGPFRRYAKYPTWERRAELGIPKETYRVRRELGLRTGVDAVDWDERSGRLAVTAHGHIDLIGVQRRWMTGKAVALRETGRRRTILLPVRQRFTPDVTAASGQARYNYDWSGVRFEVDPRRLRRRGRWVDGTWKIALGTLSRGVARAGPLRPGPSGSAAHPPYRYVADGVRIVPLYENDTLRLRVENVRALVTGYRFDGDAVVLEGRCREVSPEGALLRLRHLRDDLTREYPVISGDGARFTVRVPQADLARDADVVDREVRHGERGDESAWRTLLVADGREHRLVVADDVTCGRHAVQGRDRDGREVVVRRCRRGYLELAERSVRAVIDSAAWTEAGELRLSAAYPVPDGTPVRWVLRRTEPHAEVDFPAHVRDGRCIATLTPAAVPSVAGTLPLPAGHWDLLLDRPDLAEEPLLAPSYAPGTLATLPARAETARRGYVLTDRGYDEPALEVTSDLGPGERGPFAQKLLRTRTYPELRSLPLRDAVLYDSYTGKQYSDSPRALHEELLTRGGVRLEHLWAVRDRQVELPDTATGVRLWGREWYEALATCRYIVTNAHLPSWFRRREGQVVVQCWHGAPLKRIGFDIADVRFANAGYLDKLAQETRNWSFLVSPSRFSTPILRRAFRYEGEILESGYPRNDRLFAPEREAAARRVRERLGVPPGRRVVLYAPTWRDDRFYGPGRYRLDLHLDVPAARRALGEDHVLLVRGHPNTVDGLPADDSGFLRDVTGYPDVGELLLAADVLVTDYSSLMFDFAATGKPMIFFAYDLAHYRDELRGFYLDFPAEAPGPVVTTSTELIDALRAGDDLAARHADAYASFVRRYCDLDDGTAAARVIDRMLR